MHALHCVQVGRARLEGNEYAGCRLHDAVSVRVMKDESTALKIGGALGDGAGVAMSRQVEERRELVLGHAHLVDMLKRPPKHVPELRTREGFRRYFSGMARARMEALLAQSYADLEPADALKKVKKRLGLVPDPLV